MGVGVHLVQFLQDLVANRCNYSRSYGDDQGHVNDQSRGDDQGRGNDQGRGDYQGRGNDQGLWGSSIFASVLYQ